MICDLQMMDTRIGLPCPFRSVVIDSISLPGARSKRRRWAIYPRSLKWQARKHHDERDIEMYGLYIRVDSHYLSSTTYKQKATIARSLCAGKYRSKKILIHGRIIQLFLRTIYFERILKRQWPCTWLSIQMSLIFYLTPTSVFLDVFSLESSAQASL